MEHDLMVSYSLTSLASFSLSTTLQGLLDSGLVKFTEGLNASIMRQIMEVIILIQSPCSLKCQWIRKQSDRAWRIVMSAISSIVTSSARTSWWTTEGRSSWRTLVWPGNFHHQDSCASGFITQAVQRRGQGSSLHKQGYHAVVQVSGESSNI